MAVRRPLVLVGGRQKELPPGDSLPGSGGGAATGSVDVDFGVEPVESIKVTFADAAAVVGLPVIMTAALGTGYDDDENEMDAYVCAARCSATGFITAVIVSVFGAVMGTRKFAYQIGVTDPGYATRTAFSDANYTVLPTDTLVVQTGTLTAVRTVSLPAANTVAAGKTIRIGDASGTATAVNTIDVDRAGSDTINGGTTASQIASGRSLISFTSDGVSNWDVLSSLDITGVLTANAVDGALTLRTAMTSGGGASAVPISLFAANNVAGTAAFDHAIAILGLMQPASGSIAGAYFGAEGRVDYGLTTGSATGILGLATFNTATAHPGVTATGVRARAEVGPSGVAGTGLALALYATAVGGGANVHALFGDGAASGDNGLILLKGYITAKPGSTQVVLNVDDTTDTFFIDCSDTGLLGATIKLKDTAAASKFKVIDSAGTTVFEADSAGVGKIGGKVIANRVALAGWWQVMQTAGTNTRSGPSANLNMGVRMPWAGRIVGISCNFSSGPVTAGSNTSTVHKNGSSTAIAATLNTTNSNSVSATGSVTFAAGDILDVRSTQSSVAPNGYVESTIFVEFDN